MSHDSEAEWAALRVWAGLGDPEASRAAAGTRHAKVGGHRREATTDTRAEYELPSRAVQAVVTAEERTGRDAITEVSAARPRVARPMRFAPYLIGALVIVAAAVVLANAGGHLSPGPLAEVPTSRATPSRPAASATAGAGPVTPSASAAATATVQVPGPAVTVRPAVTVLVQPPLAQPTPPPAAAPLGLPRQGAIVGIGGLCVDDNGAIASNGSRIKLWTCNQTVAQVWTLWTDATFRVVGYCMRITGNAITPGSRVEIWTCDGTASQHWSFEGDHIVHAPSGLCLASPGDLAQAGIELTVAVCGSAPGQRWMPPPPL